MSDLDLNGFPLDGDALWHVSKDGQTHTVTEYNQEVTGFSDGLKDVLRYGDNAYYWLWHPSQFEKLGYVVERQKRRP